VLRTLVYKETLVAGTRNRWFAVRILPYRTVENVIDGVVITFTDASAAKAMEATLLQQTNELRQMAESLTNLVLGFRIDGSCDYASPQWTEYTGVPVAELLGNEWLQTLHDEDRERARDAWRASTKSGTALDLQFRLRAKDGSYRWFKSRTIPIRDAQGRLIKWYGTTSDVHDLKQAADLRKQAAERLISLLESAGEPFFTLGDGENVSFANRAAQRLLGSPGKDISGKAFVSVVPELGGGTFRDCCREVIRENREVSFETDALGRDRFVVRIFPLVEGVGIHLRPHARTQSAGTDGDAQRREEG
jgi:PAS domain S-box-containing protein